MSNTRSKILFTIAALVIGTAILCAGCSAEKKQPTDGNPVVITLETVPKNATPGDSVTLVWKFDLATDWHLYWAGRNDTGFPPLIDLELPAGWVAGGLQWPVPERQVSAGDILDHVYFGELILIQKIGAPDDAILGGQVEIKADIQWLACKDMCVPGRTHLTVSLPVRSHADNFEPNSASRAAARLPVPLPDGILETRWEAATFHIQSSGARRLTFMPTDDCGRLVDLLKDGQAEQLALRFKPKGETVGPVRGLITIEQESGNPRTYRIDYPAALHEAAHPGG